MNFLKAQKSYAKAAIVQNFMGDRLCEILLKSKRKNFTKVFEFGCASGEFTQKLQAKICFEKYITNDILPFENADLIFDMNELESQKISKEKFDLIASNACFQWLDASRVLRALSKMLDKNGFLLISSFGENNLREVKKATNLGLNYLSSSELKNQIKTHFKILEFEEKIMSLHFENALECFRHLKLSGVNSLGKFNLTKAFLTEFEKKFNNTLSYHPILILAKKL